MGLKKDIHKDYYILSEETQEVTTSEVKAAIMTFNIDDINTNGKKWAVYDITQCRDISSEAISFLTKFKHQVRRAHLNFAVLAQGNVYKDIIDQGFSESLFVFSSLEEFQQKSHRDTSKAAAEFLNTLLESIIHSTGVLLRTEVKTLPCVKVSSFDKSPRFQIGAIAGIVSNYFNGRLIICFSNEEFYKTMGQFLSTDVKELKNEPFEEIRDGAAELLNIFIGQAKAKLNDKFYNIQKVIPSVISGDNIRVSPPEDGHMLIIPFVCDFGNFAVLLTSDVRKSA